MNKPELLAPAGTFEKAKVAFMYGADAVYAGTSKLSLRTRTEMQFDDLINTVKLAHSLNKKVYVAMNIYARDDEYELIKEEAKHLDEIGVDGIIIPKDRSVDVNSTVSTQANVVSLHSCNFWYKNGAKRVILARELNKDEIKHITEHKPNGLDIEMFVHGAICYSYSGRCYMSDYMAGRSANCGDCAQPCRWSYNLYVEEKNTPGEFLPIDYDENGTYIFSSKDMCLLKDIPTIFDLGVDSLKIEGRLKTEYYLATVVNAYRHAIDDYYNNPADWNFEKYMVELEKAKTRGITDFYFNGKYNKDIQDYDGKQINPDYEFAGVVVSVGVNDIATVEIRNKLSVGDKLEVMIPNVLKPYEMTIEKLYDYETGEDIETVNPGVKEQKVKFKIGTDVKSGYIIRRVKNV